MSQPVLAAVRPVVKTSFSAQNLAGLLDGAHDSLVERRPCAPSLDAFVLINVLSPGECDRLMTRSEQLAPSFWHEQNTQQKRDFRNADTVEVRDEEFAARVFQRLRHTLDASITLTEGDRRWQRDIAGVWVPVGINPVILFARYNGGGHFSPHTDGNTIVDFNHRSFYSLLLYLNTCTSGGATRLLVDDGDNRPEFERDAAARFRWPEDCVRGAAPVMQGTALAFYQDIPHEGEPVAPGHQKYIIRTDIMYERRPMLCTAAVDMRAYALFREAECLEGEGDPLRAARLYQQAVKLSPALAEVYGL